MNIGSCALTALWWGPTVLLRRLLQIVLGLAVTSISGAQTIAIESQRLSDLWAPGAASGNWTAGVFGEQVDVSGPWVAVSAAGQSHPRDTSLRRGTVFVYQRQARGFGLKQILAHPDPVSGRWLGNPQFGDTELFLADPSDSALSTLAGRVLVYRRIAHRWHFAAFIDSPRPLPLDGFGRSMATANGDLFVGANGAVTLPSGTIYRFERVGGAWVYSGEELTVPSGLGVRGIGGRYRSAKMFWCRAPNRRAARVWQFFDV